MQRETECVCGGGIERGRKKTQRRAESPSPKCVHINAALRKSSQPGGGQGHQRLPGP